MKLKESQKVFNALADPTRLRILNLLIEGELCVCDLMAVLKSPQSKISRHLAYLRKARLAQSRREGLWMHYRLSKPAGKLEEYLLDALRKSRAEFAELAADLKVLNKNRDCMVGCCS